MGINRPGPTPKPTALRILQGERRDRINTQEPKPEPGIPQCPEHACERVKAIWDYTVDHLAKMGCVTLADRDMLYAYCEAVELHQYTSEVIAKTKAKPRDSTWGIWEAVKMQKSAADSMRQLGAHFGLSPSSRSTIKVGDKPTDDRSAERYLSA